MSVQTDEAEQLLQKCQTVTFHCRCIKCWSSLQQPDRFNWTALVFRAMTTRAIYFRCRILKYRLKWSNRLEKNLPFPLVFQVSYLSPLSVSPLLSYSISPCSVSCLTCLNWNYLSPAFESQAVQSRWNCESIPLFSPKDDNGDKIIIIIIIIILLFQSAHVNIIVKSESKKPQRRRKMM